MEGIRKRGSVAFMGLRMIMDHEPYYLLYSIPRIFFSASLPLLYVYFPKLIIQKLVEGGAYHRTAGVIAMYATILLGMNMVNTYLGNGCAMSAAGFSRKLKGGVGRIAMGLEFQDVEKASCRDAIRMASNAEDLTDTMMIAQGIISNMVTFAGLAYVIVKLDWLFILLVVVALTAKATFVRLQYSWTRKRRSMHARNDRHGNYLTDLSYFNNGGAKEVRLNSAQTWFMGKIRGYRNGMVSMQLEDLRIHTAYELITAVIVSFQSLVILWVLSARYMDGAISIADFTMYFAAVAAATASLSTLVEQIGDYNRKMLSVSDYHKLADLVGTVTVGESSASSAGVPSRIEFAFNDVSFTYPNTDLPILDCINITIANSEKLVIVGPNGAGKSTFVKLLCKLYRPTQGTITLNGTDIWEIPNEKYYKVVTAVFQDFSNFAFPLRENVSMSEDADDDRVTRVIAKVGLSGYVSGLSNGLDTCVSRQFDDDGTELSGGQGQKLAIARAVYRGTPVLVLDEPTANLDPKAESEVYADFFRVMDGKTTIFISHRLAASTMADNVAVLSAGKIVEYGPHSVLMEQRGIYAGMFKRQSMPYVDVSGRF